MLNPAVPGKMHWTHDQDRLNAWAPAGRKICARDRIQTLRPLGRHLEQARTAVAKARRRIRAHHVDIAPTSLVLHIDAGAADDRDRQWRIICRAETLLGAAKSAATNAASKRARRRDGVARSPLMACSPIGTRSLIRASVRDVGRPVRKKQYEGPSRARLRYSFLL